MIPGNSFFFDRCMQKYISFVSHAGNVDYFNNQRCQLRWVTKAQFSTKLNWASFDFSLSTFA